MSAWRDGAVLGPERTPCAPRSQLGAISSALSPRRGSPRVSKANTSDQEGKGEALAEPWRRPRTGWAMAAEEAG